MKFILGTKQHMTQYFDEDGRAHAATVVLAGPMTVLSLKTKEKDGYESVQVAYGTQKKERISKPELGHMKDLGTFRHLKEYRLPAGEAAAMKVGDVMDADVFAKGDTITVTATSKGKGFQGVVKRHGFHGGPRSHGQKHSEREPGSIGGGLRTRVPKGMRMAGRMGSDTISIRNLKVLAVDQGSHMILVRGAIPGRRGTLVSLKGI